MTDFWIRVLWLLGYRDLPIHYGQMIWVRRTWFGVRVWPDRPRYRRWYD